MPIRSTPLVTGEFYHIVNRGNASLPIFKTKRDYQYFLNAFSYYQNSCPPFKFSKLESLSQSEKKEILEKLKEKRNLLVEIIAYCLMPNHYHFLLKQVKNKGIFNFIRLLGNSYSHYFNTKHQRKGSLFEGRFKAIRVETENQLFHLSRYIHLNPYSSFVIKDIRSLLLYPFSSLQEHLGINKGDICNKEVIYARFSKIGDYKKFIFDHADYQRSLERIKHQLLEK